MMYPKIIAERTIFICVPFLFFLELTCLPLFAGIDPTFGFELTFTNESLLAGEARKIPVAVLVKRFKELCPLCTGEGGKLIFPSGFRIEIKNDPGVYEVTGTPLNLAGFLQHETEISLIFEVMKEFGYRPHPVEGGGHINIDADKSFADDTHRRNFIVDFHNHPELAMGVFEFDVLNSAPLLFYSQPVREYFADALHSFDQGKINFFDLTKAYRRAILKEKLRGLDSYVFYMQQSLESRYSALNVNNTSPRLAEKGQSRIEIRSFRAQANFKQLFKDATLLDARIRYLQDKPPIPLQVNPQLGGLDGMRENFKRYVVESGLVWKDYWQYVPRDWVEWFQAYEIPCAALKSTAVLHRHLLKVAESKGIW